MREKKEIEVEVEESRNTTSGAVGGRASASASGARVRNGAWSVDERARMEGDEEEGMREKTDIEVEVEECRDATNGTQWVGGRAQRVAHVLSPASRANKAMVLSLRRATRRQGWAPCRLRCPISGKRNGRPPERPCCTPCGVRVAIDPSSLAAVQRPLTTGRGERLQKMVPVPRAGAAAPPRQHLACKMSCGHQNAARGRFHRQHGAITAARVRV